MDFIADASEQGVRERRFDLKVGTEVVPGALWSPDKAEGPRPKVLIGHGGTQHKKVANVVALARQLVRHVGYACVAIDAPGHGDRLTAEQRAAAREARAAGGGGGRARAAGRGAADTSAPFPERFMQGVAEWKATLDEIEKLPEVGTGPTGYWGVSMGTSIGLPLSATEPRMTCTVLGLASMTPRPGREQYIEWAKSLQIPLLFLCQADDAGHPLDLALELYGYFGPTEKSMHINPGPHVGIPLFERAAVEDFYRRHLGVAAGA
jgi:pimeloyl-ACP methyl ester carboxylesterase